MTVMATTTILFVLATTLMMMVAYQTSTTTIRTTRLKATHVADAGINAYLYQIKNSENYGYYRTSPDTGWVTVNDSERYRVVATPPTNGAPLTLRSTGVSRDGTVTIVATVRFPSFGDYMFLTNSDMSIAGDALINGAIRSNGDVVNQGQVIGKVTAGGTVSGNGRFGQGYESNQPIVPFDQVLSVMSDIQAQAKLLGTYFGPSGAYGYRVTISGNSVLVEKVTDGTTTGDFVTTPLTTFTIPNPGVLYFDDNVWIQGAFSVPVSVVGSHDMYIIGDYQPSDPNSTATSGLIANGNIIVPAWYKSVKDTMSIDAALLSATGRVYADIKQGVIRSRINITGSISAYDSGGTWGSYDKFTGQPIAGFRQNVYNYDPRLSQYPPPMYPVVMDGSLKVDTWVEDHGNPAF